MLRRLQCLAWVLALMLLVPVSVWAEGVRTAVSIPPQKYFVQRIGGEMVEVAIMVPPGADPHTYEPRPSQMAALSGARLYFSMGMEFESVWLARFRGMSQGMEVVPMHLGVERVSREEDAHGHGLPDPHIWLSPPLVRIMAANILKALVQADPGNAGQYRKNYALFCQEVEELDAGILEFLARNKVLGREFLVFHPSFGYFADHYALRQTVIEAGGKEPGPVELARLIEHARERGLNTVFVEPQFSEKSARVVARAIGGSVVRLNPLAEDWTENMWSVVRAVAAGAK